MRILQITHQYPPHHIGGVELLTQQLSQQLAMRGHEVHVLTRAPIATYQFEQGNGLHLHRLPENGSPMMRFFATFRDAAMLNATTRIIQSIQPDVVHIQHLMGFPLEFIDVIQRQGIPYILSLHDFWLACLNTQLITNFDQQLCDGPSLLKCSRCLVARANLPDATRLGFAPLLAHRQTRLRPVIQQAHAIIANSRFVQRWFATHGYAATDWPVLEVGIDLPSNPQIGQSDIHAPNRFAFIGSVAWQKGVHVLIEAFNAMPANTQLTIAGDLTVDPAYVRRLRSLATHPGIRFAGKLNRAQVWGLLNETDVVAVPSQVHETASLIAREALAAGCYVLASDLGALSELIEQHPQRGQALPPNAVDAWQQAMQNLTSFARRPQPMPSVADYARRVEGIYSNLRESHPSARDAPTPT